MTEPTLILHIGAPKSASTALQGFLRRKARSLLRKGVAAAGNKLYFNFEDEFVGHGGTIKFFSDILRNQENKTVVTERILEAANRASKRDIRLLVISCEFLMGTQHKTAVQKVEIFRAAARELPVRIVAYLRPQYSYIPSAWTQWFDRRRIMPLYKFIDYSHGALLECVARHKLLQKKLPAAAIKNVAAAHSIIGSTSQLISCNEALAIHKRF